jgi:hypothetical protein
MNWRAPDGGRPPSARILEITKAEGDPSVAATCWCASKFPALAPTSSRKGAEATAAEARLEVARENLVRLRFVHARCSCAEGSGGRWQRVSDAQGALSQAQAGRDSARQLANRTTVIATFNGVIAKRCTTPAIWWRLVHRSGAARDRSDRLQVDASVAIPTSRESWARTPGDVAEDHRRCR